MANNTPRALVIGAGPAGLMAAEVLSEHGLSVTIAESKTSPARKFLMAGKSGLNITKNEAPAQFGAAYEPSPALGPCLAAFGPQAVMDWMRGLDQIPFTGSSQRVFPVAMKASPLLRAWLGRLARAGVTLRLGWRWHGVDDKGHHFDTPDGHQIFDADVTVLALGGASWARLGSDGLWVPLLQDHGVTMAPWQPSNMGLTVSWSPHMARHFGQPIKGAALECLGKTERGEFVITAKGLEGGGIYALSSALRQSAPLNCDFMPDVPRTEVSRRLAMMKPSESRTNRLRKLGLGPASIGLIMEWGRTMPLLDAVKSLNFHHLGPRPLDEAISVAGGVAWSEVTEGFELRRLSNVFVAGEMMDWDAPTGGYLITACLATGRWAARHAALRAKECRPQS